MSRSNTNDNGPSPLDDDVISINGSLLGDVHIGFGHDEEEEDSVFDKNLMQYLDQLPIAAPPADANYSASFVDRVLNDMETFKRETGHLSYDTEEPFVSSLLGSSSFAFQEAHSQEQDAFSVGAVEQPRGGDGPLYQEQDEMPIRFTMHQDDLGSVFQPALSIDHSTEYSDYLDLFNLGQDQPSSTESEATFLAQRKAELDALFDLNGDAPKDFSSWLYYSDDDASQVHFKDDMTHQTTSALYQETSHNFFTECPMESKHDPFSTASFPFEKSHLSHSKAPLPPYSSTGFTTTHAYGDVCHQSANAFLQRMEAIVAEKRNQSGLGHPLNSNKNKSSTTTPTNHATTHVPRRHNRRYSSVNIAKADFMFVSSSSSSKYSSSLSDISKKSEHSDSSVKGVIGTSTPAVKKSLAQKQPVRGKQPVNSSNRRSSVLEEVDKNAPATSSSTLHRFSMRARTSPGAIRKTHITPNKPLKSPRTFNFSRSSKKR